MNVSTCGQLTFQTLKSWQFLTKVQKKVVMHSHVCRKVLIRNSLETPNAGASTVQRFFFLRGVGAQVQFSPRCRPDEFLGAIRVAPRKFRHTPTFVSPQRSLGIHQHLSLLKKVRSTTRIIVKNMLTPTLSLQRN